MPDINIDSITLSESSVGIGDEVIFEVCITNNGDRGDIELYTGFAYQDFIGGPALFLNGYLQQTIGDVIEGESFCPYGEISVTQEVTDAKKSGKDVKFWTLAVPGNSLSKSINIEISQEPIFCTQYFRIEDQDGNPLLGTITSPDWDIDLQVPNTGEASLYMEQGIAYTVTAYNYEHNLQQALTFTTCTSQPLVFVLDIPEPCRQYFKVVDIDNNSVTDVTIKVPGEFSLSVDENGELSYTLIKNEVHEIEVLQHHEPVAILIYSGTFTVCTINPLVIEVDTTVHEIGEIGTITYEIIKQVGNDEITFFIPVTNHTDEEQCFYVNLMNPDDETEVLEKAPNVPLIGRIADRIPAADTEIIELSSTWDVRWNINNVLGKTVKFELRHSEPILDALGVVVCNPLKSAYDMIHEVTIDLINIDIIVSICADNTEGLITKDLQIGLMYSDPTTLTKTDVCGSPMNVIDTVSEEICTSYHRPGPFTCSGAAYLADSMFVAYARGFDDEDNEYIITSPIFRSIYGTKNISIKVTGEPIEECFIDHPTDPTKCLITEGQWKVIKWTAAGLGVVYVASVAAPMVKGIGTTLERKKELK